MNEFSKPYEYFDEKGVGGILLIFFFMLVAIEPLLGILSAYTLTNAVKGSSVLTIGVICASVLFILFSFITGVTLKKLRRNAIVLAKVFLIYRFLYMIPAVIISMRAQTGAIPFAKGYMEYDKMYGGIVTSFAVSLAYVVLFSFGWYFYLVRSKKGSQSVSED